MDSTNIHNFAVGNMIFLIFIGLITKTVSLTSISCRRQNFGPGQYSYRSSESFRSRLKNGLSDEAIGEQEEKFKIVTCMSTACSRKREQLGMDSLSTYGCMYSRAKTSRVQVEEGPCVGSCQKAPCVTVEHEDFFGSVALEGMTDDEFDKDAFLNVVTEEDADRVWSSVANAVQVMAEAEEDED